MNPAWQFGPTAFCGDAHMLIGHDRSARYYPMSDPWGCFKVEFWSTESHAVFGPVRWEHHINESEARAACERWTA